MLSVEVNKEIIQGSPEWHKARRGGIGGSEIAIVLGISPYRTRHSLWLEKTGKKEPDNISHLAHVRRGVEGEIVARAIVEDQLARSYEPRTWVYPGREYLRASDDGFNEEHKEVLEIKCMGRDAHQSAILGDVPKHYEVQCQYNMALSGAQLCRFISYRPEDNDLAIVEIKANMAEQLELLKAAHDFWVNHVIANVPPELTDKDVVTCTDNDFKADAEEYLLLKAKVNELEASLKLVEERLKARVTDNTEAGGISGFGLKISSYVKKGLVDYKRVKELEGVDLEQYRNPSSVMTRITMEKNKNEKV